MGDEEFVKLNSAEAHAHLAAQHEDERSRLFQLYKARVGIGPLLGPTRYSSSNADKWSKQWKPALLMFLVAGGLICMIGTCTIDKINAPPPSPTETDLSERCEAERRAQDVRNAQRQRAQAALTDAETALSASTPELREYYQRALEQETGLLPGQGRGWRTV